jgi:hypothetical protein
MTPKILKFEKNERIAVLQFKTDDADTLDYISGKSAIDRQFITVEEVSEGGSVNNLKLHNNSDKYVFFFDGDILVGAKQNRILNTSVLIAPKITTGIPVSCVERGRWSYRTRHFGKSDFTAPYTFRKSKHESMKNSMKHGSYQADQSKVWKEVSDYSMRMDCHSVTDDFDEIMMKKRKSVEDSFKGFTPDADANGLSIFHNGKIILMEIFNRRDVYSEYFPQIIRSTGFDFYMDKDDDGKIDRDKAVEKLGKRFSKISEEKFHERPSVGTGTEKRYDTDKFECFELLLDGKTVHFSYLK